MRNNGKVFPSGESLYLDKIWQKLQPPLLLRLTHHLSAEVNRKGSSCGAAVIIRTSVHLKVALKQKNSFQRAYSSTATDSRSSCSKGWYQ